MLGNLSKEIIKPIQDVKMNMIMMKLGFTPCKAEQPLQGMELQEKQTQKDYSIQKISLEKIFS